MVHIRLVSSIFCLGYLYERLVICFFFFKQKTPYELRISDWSSDVCSSDLPVQIQQAELSAAMATGVIESYMSSGSTGYDTKTYEHIKNFYDTRAWIPKNAILVNAKAFDALDAASKAAVTRTEESRVGKECVRQGKYRWSPDQ